MAVIPNSSAYEQLPARELLIIDIMVAVDYAIERDEPVSTYDLAEQIVVLVEESQEHDAQNL